MITTTIEGKAGERFLVVRVPMDGEGATSKSGKSTVLASSNGAITPNGAPDLRLNLTLYRPTK